MKIALSPRGQIKFCIISKSLVFAKVPYYWFPVKKKTLNVIIIWAQNEKKKNLTLGFAIK